MANWQERYKAPHWVVTRRTASLVGRVVDALSSLPIPGAAVAITVASGQLPLAHGVCRSDGSFVFLSLPWGTYWLTAAAFHLGGRYGKGTPADRDGPDGWRQWTGPGGAAAAHSSARHSAG